MGMKKIKKQAKGLLDNAFYFGYDEGYDNGFSSGFEEGGVEAFDNGFIAGVKAERDRIIGMFEMLSKMNMEQGSAGKAKAYFDAAAMVRVADELEAAEENQVDDEETYGLIL